MDPRRAAALWTCIDHRISDEAYETFNDVSVAFLEHSWNTNRSLEQPERDALAEADSR
jgi:hypothetical protein